MPFKSKAQQRFMFAAEASGELKPGTAKKWADETKSIKKLPEKVKNSVRSRKNRSNTPKMTKNAAIMAKLALLGRSAGIKSVVCGPKPCKPSDEKRINSNRKKKSKKLQRLYKKLDQNRLPGGGHQKSAGVKQLQRAFIRNNVHRRKTFKRYTDKQEIDLPKTAMKKEHKQNGVTYVKGEYTRGEIKDGKKVVKEKGQDPYYFKKVAAAFYQEYEKLAERKDKKKAGRCWSGYKPTPGKEPYSDGSCMKQAFFQEWEKLASAWQRKEGKNESGGLTERGRKSYERENPGSDLKAPVTSDNPKGKAAARKKSFCARSAGMRKLQKPENNTGKDRLSLARKKWNC